MSIASVQGIDSTIATGAWRTSGESVEITWGPDVGRPAERLGLIERWQVNLLAPRPYDGATLAGCYAQAIAPDDTTTDYGEDNPDYDY